MGKGTAEAQQTREELRREFAATLLFEAAFSTDEEVAARHGVGVRSIERYRQRLGEDVLLAGLLAAKRRAFEHAGAGLPPVLLEAAGSMEEIARALREGRAPSPEEVERVARTFRAVAEALPAGKAGAPTTRNTRRGGLPLPSHHKW